MGTTLKEIKTEIDTVTEEEAETEICANYACVFFT